MEWSQDLWICLCFFQKKGRTVIAQFDGASYKKGDVLEAMRPLRDYREGGREKTGGGEDVLCNDYFSTMRAATDKRSSPVERVDPWASPKRLKPHSITNY